MRLQEVQIMALDLMHKHGLIERGWTYAFDNARRRLGVCNYTRKQISLSRHLVALNDEPEVRETILHEIAHAVALIRYGPAGGGHGVLWRQVCEEIGAKPVATCSKDEVNLMPGDWVMRHKETGEVFAEYYKYPERDISRSYIRGRKKETLGKLEIVPNPKNQSGAASREVSVPANAKWAIINMTTGEIYSYHRRCPKVGSSHYIVHKKAQTLGKLAVVTVRSLLQKDEHGKLPQQGATYHSAQQLPLF